MITEIPTESDFAQTALNLLNLAWEIAVDHVRRHEQYDQIYEEDPDAWEPTERADATKKYWEKSQGALANGLALIQQAVEFALKGRIASVSPFLLITRDSREYPTWNSETDVPFSLLRSIDAADLLRVHNAVCSERLDSQFRDFWETARRQRNVIMHSVNHGKGVTPENLLLYVLSANRFLFAPEPWTNQRLRYSGIDAAEAAYAETQRDLTLGNVLANPSASGFSLRIGGMPSVSPK